MKLHTLKSVWQSRRLPEGGHSAGVPGTNSSDEEFFFCSDPTLNLEIENLHTLARRGCPDIQPHIDMYIPAVAYLNENPDKARMARKMVLSRVDSPQEGTLPDLGPLLRAMLEGSDRFAGSHALSILHQALPCLRKTEKKQQKCSGDHQIGINILMGLLLGLYPSCLKFPPFSVRVTIYTRIHRLLTHGTGISFCESHPMLLTLAFMEYCAHVIPAYLPAELRVICEEPGMPAFFEGMHLTCDMFRQETLITGDESWDSLEKYCVAIVEKHTRTCKNRLRARLGEPGSIKVTPGAAAAFSDMPLIVPYAIHNEDPSHCIMGSELAFLAGQGETSSQIQRGFKWEHVVSMQRLIQVYPLPRNILNIQLRSLARLSTICERSALSGAFLHVCVTCVLKGQSSASTKAHFIRGQCRLDMETGQMMCASSSCHNSEVISISTLGRIICLRQQRFYLAPCCCSVQVYTGKGDELYRTKCSHLKVKTPQRSSRPRCEVCQNVATQDAHSAVDHLTGQMRTAYLCHRHTPHEHALRQVANWAQLNEEIRKRDRPLFANCSRCI